MSKSKVSSINEAKNAKKVKTNEIDDKAVDKAMKEFSEEELSISVTRGEVIDLMQQVSDNINDISRYLMEDVNVHFRQYTYPTMIKQQALINMLVSKGVFSEEDFNKEVRKISKELMEKAKEVNIDN